MCMIDGGETYYPFFQEERRARTPHTCGECSRTIASGERYEYARGCLDREWHAHKTCLQCVAVRGWLAKVCRGWLYDGVKEDLQEHLDEGYNPRFLAIAISGMEKRWQKADGSLWRPMSLPKKLPVG